MSARQYKLAVGTERAALCEDMNPTFKDLLDFILLHKEDKTFVGYSFLDIANLLNKALKEQSLFFEQDLDGKIAGVIIADISHKDKIIYVQENLAMSISRLGRFALKARQNWPDYKLEYTKHGKYKKPNTDELYKRLL